MQSRTNWIIKLSDEQIEEFFKTRGIEFERFEKHFGVDNRILIELERKSGAKDHYQISDYGISDYNIDKAIKITAEDWMVYLRSIFGDEYIESSDIYHDIPNDFVDKLTTEDILKIFGFNNSAKVDLVTEVDALLKGTRRFKIIVNDGNHVNEIEFILTPIMYYGSGHFVHKSPQGRFVKLMTKKFGKEFSDFYFAMEQKLCDEDIEAYIRDRKARLLELKEHMEKYISK